MAFRLAEGYVQLEQRGFGGVAGAVDSIRGKLGSLTAPVNQFGSAVSSFLGNTAANILSNVASQVTGTARSMFELASAAEDNQIAFEVMLDSADKATAMLAEMKSFADATPFTPQQIRDAGKVLLQFGVDAGSVMDTVKMLGDVSGGDAEKMNRLALAFGQISSAGRLQGQDLLQLINAGFNPLQVISEKTGESMADLKTKMEHGGISSQAVADAFQAATSEGGQFFGMMERRSKTFSGLMSTLTGDIDSALGTLGAKLIEGLGFKDLVGEASVLVKGIGESISGIADQIIPPIRSALEAVGGLFQTMAGRAAGEIGALFGGNLNLSGITSGLEMVSGGVQTVVGWLQEWFAYIAPIDTAYRQFLSTVGELFVTVFSSAGETLSVFWETFGADIQSAGGWLRNLSVQSIQFVTEFVNGVRMVVENWDLSWQIIVERAGLAWNNVIEIARARFTNFGELFNWLGKNWYDVLMTMFDAASTVFINIGTNIREVFSKIWDWVSSGFQGELQIDWTPLTEGFWSTIKELPNLTEAEIKTTNDKLEKLYGEFADRESKRTEERLKGIEAAVPPVIPQNLLDSLGGGSEQKRPNDSTSGKSKAPQFVGFADLNKTMQATVQSAVTGKNETMQQIDLAGKQVDHLEKLVNQGKALQEFVKKMPENRPAVYA